MAKFTNKNIEFKDNQKAVFGDNDDSTIYWDGNQLVITTVVSGVTPVSEQDLTTKKYVDDADSALSSTIDGLSTEDINFPVVGTTTYSNLKQYLNLNSAGFITSNGMSVGGDNTLTVSSGTGVIKLIDNDFGEIRFIDWPTTSGIELTNKTTSWIYVNYNVETEEITVEATTDIYALNLHTQVVIGRAFRYDTTVKFLNGLGQDIDDYMTEACFKDFEVNGFQRASGYVISEANNRYLAMTAGVCYCAHNRLYANAINTYTGGDTFIYVYRDGGTDWIYDDNGGSEYTQVSNILYDDGDGTPGNINNNRYATYYVYCMFSEGDSKLYVQMGQNNALSLTKAQLEETPTPSDFLRDFCSLIAKIIVYKGATNFTEIEHPFDQPFTASSVSNHNDLSNLQGGTTSEYYHLTLAQATVVGNTSGVNTGDQDLSTYTLLSQLTTTSGVLQSEIDGKSDLGHTHDDRYYTESESDNLLTTLSGNLQSEIDTKSDSTHLHDDRYYTEAEVDVLITTISGKLDDHNELNNLDYESSGHTGFASSTEITTLSGALQSNIDGKSDLGHTHDDRYYTESEVDALFTTISGNYTSTDFDTDFTTKDTDDLSEGSTNLYSQWGEETSGISYTSGNVGIGTVTDPAYKLQVLNTTNPPVSLSFNGDFVWISEWQSNAIPFGLRSYVKNTTTSAPVVGHGGGILGWAEDVDGAQFSIYGIEGRTDGHSSVEGMVYAGVNGLCIWSDPDEGNSNTFAGIACGVVGRGDVLANDQATPNLEGVSIGLWAQNPNGGGIANGVYISDITSHTLSVGLNIAGADDAAIWLGSGADNTDAQNGIFFGLSRDTNLYRSSANTLKTDDSFVVGSSLTVGSTATVLDTTPTENGHLTSKIYVDNLVSTTSGTLRDEVDAINTTLGSLDHGADLAGLDDDDHSQYLLASDATNRTTFATNWGDLTDGGDTTLHDHDGISENTSARHTRSHTITSSSDHTAGNWKVVYTNGTGVVTELTLGAANTVLKSNGATSAPTFTASTSLPIELSTDTTPQLGGNLDVNDHNIVLTPSPGTNQTVNGVTASMTVGENVAFGNLLYMKSDGKLWKADADASTTVPCIAMAAASITADSAGVVLLSGFARDDAWAWTVGSPILVSATAGTPSHTVPSSTGQQVQRVGVATHADRMYFNPDLTVVEVQTT